MAEKTEKWKAARTKNLTAAQMKQARRVVGGKRSEAVSAREMKAAKKTVDIGGTKWMEASARGGKGRGGLLVDASGNAVTGTVTLPSGQKASYVRGKRIGVMRKAGQGKGTSGVRVTGPNNNPPSGPDTKITGNKSATSATVQAALKQGRPQSGTVRSAISAGISGGTRSAPSMSAQRMAAKYRRNRPKMKTVFDPITGQVKRVPIKKGK
jgi:hypothetical protein